MKKLTIHLMVILFTISGLMNNVLAQAPEGIIYQAEARDNKNNLITNKALDVKIIIIQDTPTGYVAYEESHKVTTNIYGMFVLVIGQGTSGQLLKDVDWGNHPHFLNVQVKEAKKIVWTDMGTSQLLSVPYALHAKTAETVTGTIITETDPVYSRAPVASITDAGSGAVITDAERTKLSGIADGAEVNVQSDWNEPDNTKDSYIANKPTNVSTFTNDAGYLMTENQNLTIVLTKGTDAGNQKIVNVNQLGVGTSTPSVSAALEINSTTQGFLPPRMTNSQMSALTPVVGLMIYNTTAKSPMFYNGTDWMKIDGSAYLNLYIGKSYQGGIIAYIFKAGDPGYVGGETHGLIVAPSDQSAGAEWGCYGQTMGANGIALGTGNQNTIAIINGCTDDYAVFAAKICANLNISGYSDWFLPSKNELNIIFQNRTANMNFSSSPQYWTSTEKNAWEASIQYMDSGTMYDDNNKGGEYRVRAIRAF